MVAQQHHIVQTARRLFAQDRVVAGPACNGSSWWRARRAWAASSAAPATAHGSRAAAGGSMAARQKPTAPHPSTPFADLSWCSTAGGSKRCGGYFIPAGTSFTLLSVCGTFETKAAATQTPPRRTQTHVFTPYRQAYSHSDRVEDTHVHYMTTNHEQKSKFEESYRYAGLRVAGRSTRGRPPQPPPATHGGAFVVTRLCRASASTTSDVRCCTFFSHLCRTR